MTFKNPEEKLDELRRSSLIELEHLKQPNHPMAPLRELPEHSVGLPESAVRDNVKRGLDDPVGLHDGAQDAKSNDTMLLGKAAENPSSGTTLFKEPDFGANGAGDRSTEDVPLREDALSPTQTRV